MARRLEKPDLSGFRPITDDRPAIYLELVYFIRWLHKNNVLTPIFWTDAVQAIHSQKSSPGSNSPLIKQLQAAMSKAKKIVLLEDKISVIPVIGVGFRIAANASDHVMNNLKYAAGRYRAAGKAFILSNSIVRPKDLNQEARALHDKMAPAAVEAGSSKNFALLDEIKKKASS